MAAHANTTTAPAIATLAIQASIVSETKIRIIQNAADYLASLMQEVHGGSWRVDIDHGVNALVLVRSTLDKAITKPNRGEIA